MKQKGHAIASFAHFLGLPTIKSHAVNAVHRISSARSMEVIKKLASPKRKQVVADSTPFMTAISAIEQPHSYEARRDDKEVAASERTRCKQIMTHGVELGHVSLAYTLAFETGLSAASAMTVLTAVHADAGNGNNRRTSVR